MSQHIPQSFLPKFCDVKTVFIVILVAELLAIVLTLVDFGSIDMGLLSLAAYSLFIQWVVLPSTAILCILSNVLTRLSDISSACLCYLVIMIITLIVSLASWQLMYTFPEFQVYSEDDQVFFFVRTMGIAAIITAIVLRYLYLQHQWRKDIEINASIRYEALQARIHPHFLFNCMNTIAELTRRSPRLAERAIEDLSEVLRANIEPKKGDYRLGDEWQLCHRYLAIEMLRIGDRLRVDWQIDELPEDAVIPPLVIQPLLENAIYHGIETLPNGGTIHITGQHQQKHISITLANLSNALLDQHQGHQKALDNIRMRLQTFFGDGKYLDIQQDEENYQITLNIPYKTL